MAEPTAGPPAQGNGVGRRRPDLATVALAVVTLLYPFIVFFAVKAGQTAWVVAGLCAFLLLRVVFGVGKRAPLGLVLAPAAVAVIMGGMMLWDARTAARFYPVFMNGAMLAAFAASLFKGPSMIERLARIAEPDLPEAGVRYTRKVTIVWCVFLLLNGLAALWTALYASLEVWTAYNGLVAYLLMGALFGGEFLVRKWVRRGEAA
jgi:uncharacterized membrane protein